MKILCFYQLKCRFWAKILGFNDFYYELGVEILHCCLRTRSQNGGIIPLVDLVNHLQDKRKGKKVSQITSDDVERSIQSLSVLGNGLRVISTEDKLARKLVVSVPMELNQDTMTVITEASKKIDSQGSCCVTKSSLKKTFSWTDDRTERTIRLLLKEGMVWVDNPQNTNAILREQDDDEEMYYFPSLCTYINL